VNCAHQVPFAMVVYFNHVEQIVVLGQLEESHPYLNVNKQLDKSLLFLFDLLFLALEYHSMTINAEP
jgi:hypothetical protein